MSDWRPPTEKTKKIGGTLADEDLEPYEGSKFDAAAVLYWRPRG